MHCLSDICLRTIPLICPNALPSKRRAGRSVPRARTSKPRSPHHAALGRAIESVIRERGLTQEAVADSAGLAVKQVGSYISGQGNPTYASLLKLCDGLHVTLAELQAHAETLLQARRPTCQSGISPSPVKSPAASSSVVSLGGRITSEPSSSSSATGTPASLT